MMARFKRPTLLGLIALTGFAILLMVRGVCACLPTEYREIDPSRLPAHALAAAIGPGLRVERAWEVGHFLKSPRPMVSGYLVRSRKPGDWWSKDARVGLAPAADDPDGPRLRPLE